MGSLGNSTYRGTLEESIGDVYDNGKTCCHGSNGESFSLTGCADELFYQEGKQAEIKLIETIGPGDDHVALILSSVDLSGKHELINKFRGSKIKITISKI